MLGIQHPAAFPVFPGQCPAGAKTRTGIKYKMISTTMYKKVFKKKKKKIPTKLNTHAIPVSVSVQRCQ